MLIFDSVMKKKVKFEPIKNGEVRIYTCGPTVYDYSHLGHAKSAVSFDFLRRFLIELGFKVKFVKNFTDIDDKILKKMDETGKSLEEITNFFIDAYQSDMEQLNVLPADVMPKATQTLDEIKDIISVLLKKQIAYKISDGIYFDTSKDSKYLSLSQKFDIQNQARISQNSEKKSEKDFVLWKFDNNFYDAPFGKGRPGWHTECVAMIKKHLGYESEKYLIDIHTGGSDLLFPHHENEASQCRCCEGKSLAKYWMHNGFVLINDEKMSKSLGNSFFIKDALKLVPGEALRFYILNSHYSSNFNYCQDDLFASKKRLDKIYRLKKRVFDEKNYKLSLDKEVENRFKAEILEALSDDLNSSLALSFVDNMVNMSNDALDKNPKNKDLKIQILSNLNFVSKIFGILQIDTNKYFQFGVDDQTKQKIQDLINKRNEAKLNKNYEKADEIRDKLKSIGISLMDTPNGVIWEKIWNQ